MLVADELGLEELANKIETFLIKTKLHDIIAKHPSLIFERTDFNSLPESKLMSFLKIENLQMKETEICDYVIKWEISQNLTLPTENDEVSYSIRPYKNILDKQLFKLPHRAEEPKESFFQYNFRKKEIMKNLYIRELSSKYFSIVKYEVFEILENLKG
ncbi:hypothetical protein Glove_5g23 [Diversispora epigaea]|uniref:BACK domain-containing protein n=1 Tax=Diversispora epigaea TaxID=1348612 RepID=A0A397JP89_9GLOM|nr:hypothetical protein Glove_5g23 [Diversispora epigaea]